MGVFRCRVYRYMIEDEHRLLQPIICFASSCHGAVHKGWTQIIWPIEFTYQNIKSHSRFLVQDIETAIRIQFIWEILAKLIGSVHILVLGVLNSNCFDKISQFNLDFSKRRISQLRYFTLNNWLTLTKYLFWALRQRFIMWCLTFIGEGGNLRVDFKHKILLEPDVQCYHYNNSDYCTLHEWYIEHYKRFEIWHMSNKVFLKSGRTKA